MPPPLQPVGPPVDARPARRPERVVLRGRFVTLVPLDAERHADALFDGVNGGDKDRLWTYLADGPFADPAAFKTNLAAKAKSDDPLFFAVVDNALQRAVGYQALMRVEPNHRAIEVGSVLYAPALQRTPGATEAQYLFARYIFDDLGYRRYEWKCDALNAPSRRAALRLGFAFEGVFRQHMIVKGRNRDTAWHAIADSEWPLRRAAFERWLAPDNFDAAGRQRASLASLRGADAGASRLGRVVVNPKRKSQLRAS
jgi:RimJ/RimL family protein N-acetyltransferase